MSSSSEMFRTITYKFVIFFLKAFMRDFLVDSYSIYFFTKISQYQKGTKLRIGFERCLEYASNYLVKHNIWLWLVAL